MQYKERRDCARNIEKVMNENEALLFRQSVMDTELKVRFDLTYNVFNFKGDWSNHVLLVMLKLPMEVPNDENLKRFEGAINEAFRNIYKV